MSTHWFQKTVDETAGELETDLKSGLSDDAARDRLARYGPNELAESKARIWPSPSCSAWLSPLF